MTHRSSVWIFLVAFGAGTPLAAQAGSANQFVPIVEVADTVAKCGRVPDVALQPGERGFLLRFGATDSISRVVTAVWDSGGVLRRYSDSRGKLDGGRGPRPVTQPGPRTTITIDVGKHMALLVNESNGRSQGSMMATVDAALEAPRLGPPRALLARLHQQCGAPAGG